MTAQLNRKHKDSLFRDLFGSAERKENALQLYNALAGTDYQDTNDLELTTLEDVIYMNVKNDVSFIVGNEMVLFEHQSTHNPNMPLRGLEYFSKLYARHVERMNANIYGARLIQLPEPRFLVFYSGAGERPEREILRLSDAFANAAFSNNPVIEVVCEVININAGNNQSVAEACPALAGYAFFISRVREYNKEGKSLSDAVAVAIEDCIAKGYLKEYFREKKAEVSDMLITEWDAERQRELDHRDGVEEGIELGLELGREEGVELGRNQFISQLREAGLTDAADLLEQTRPEAKA